MNHLAAICALTLSLIGADVHGELTTLSSCICPGYEAVFECVVTGGGATIWSGTAFDQCSSDASSITLRHSQFMSGYSLSQNCSDSGQIIGHAVSVVNNSYTSQLIVNVSQSLIGANVVCATDSEPHVGTRQILVTTALLSSPSRVNFSLINSRFTWSSISESINCEAVHYKINTMNCSQYQNSTSIGIACPTSTNTNSVSCNITLATLSLPDTCAIIIQPVVCGNVSGDKSVFPVNGTLLDDVRNEILQHSQTPTQAPISDHEQSLFPHTSTEYYTSQQSTNLNVILPSFFLLVAVILTVFVIFTMLIILYYCKHKKQEGSASSNIKLPANNSESRDSDNNSKLQQSELIYMDVGPSTERKHTWIKLDDDRVEYAMLNHQLVQTENRPEGDLSTIDTCKQLDLDNLLIQVRTQVTPKWYQFGLALGVDNDVLNKFCACPQEESIVELADYWLRNSPTKPTWRDVAEALKKIGFDSLSKDIVN